MLNNFRNHFVFCINVDIDVVLLLDKKKGLGLIILQLFSFHIIEKGVLGSDYHFAK